LDNEGRVVDKLRFKEDARFVRQESLDEPLLEVETGSLVTGDDGNMYIMRRSSSPVIFVITAGGQILRTLRLSAPDTFEPTALFFADGRLLVSFQKNSIEGMDYLYIVYEPFEGREVARFGRDRDVSGALVCYNNGKFSFLGVKDGKRVLVQAQP
jgi:hypothetical protein